MASRCFGAPPPAASRAAFAGVGSTCNRFAVSAACLRSFYNISGPVSSGVSSIGVAGLSGKYLGDPQDLLDFMSVQRPDASKSYRVRVHNVIANYSNDASNADSDVTVAVQTIAAQVYPLPLSFFSVGNDTSQVNPLLDLLHFLIRHASLRPEVLVVPLYGVSEGDYSLADNVAVCNAAHRLTDLGTTIVAGSGDRGPQGLSDKAYNEGCPAGVDIAFPANCPYVLAVGSTYDLSASHFEMLANANHTHFKSGAETSDLFQVPDWQAKELADYLEVLGNKSSGLYTPTGRSVPDLVAHGSYIQTVYAGEERLLYGTTASAAFVGAMLTLVNAARNATGKASLGQVQPLLYAHPEAFNEVGGGSYCTSPDSVGFPTARGWDIASGLGSPNYPALLAALS